MSLAGQIALVTGASRGIGRGIALQLGEAGATVYITGRRPEQSENCKIGLTGLEETANEVTERGGKGVPVFVDHGDMEQVEKLFKRIEEESGQLDILVNNAYQGVSVIAENLGEKFYKLDPNVWDTINNVGLRNNYYCSVYAARLMAPRNKGLIVNISSAGGLQYIFNVAYGVGKQALDRMSADMAEELKDVNVTVVSLWPGVVKTEYAGHYFQDENSALNKQNDTNAEFFAIGESTEYAGRAVVALAKDSKKMKKTGKILIVTDLGDEYGFKDVDGSTPHSVRSVNMLLKHFNWKRTASWIPDCVKIPGWLMWAHSNRIY